MYRVRKFAEELKSNNDQIFQAEQQSRIQYYNQQPIAQFFDGLTHLNKRSEDTFNSSRRRQKLFENRRGVIGNSAAKYSTQGTVMLGMRPELARDFDDEVYNGGYDTMTDLQQP